MVRARQSVLVTKNSVRAFGGGVDLRITSHSHSRVGVLWIRDRTDCVNRPCKVRPGKVVKLRVLPAHLASQVVGLCL
jgi:hypothetical protein